ncbi:hypothetical protein C6A85_78880, partial [Mycobacterium sp. ITM-2017-0098]
MGVSMVVERGLARCPRCVAVADYVFIEASSARELRYEVRCRKCGECYSEDSYATADTSTEVALIQWPPDCEPVPPRDWLNEVREKLSVAAEAGKAEVEVLGKHAQSLYEHSRTWLQERLAA